MGKHVQYYQEKANDVILITCLILIYIITGQGSEIHKTQSSSIIHAQSIVFCSRLTVVHSYNR